MDENIENNNFDDLLKENKPYKVALKYGFLLATLTIIIDLVFFIVTDDPNATNSGGLSILQMVVLGALTIYLAAKEHSNNDLQGFIPYKRILKIGFLIGIVSGLVTGIYMVLKSKYIYDPNIDIEQRIAEELEKASPNISAEEFEKAKLMATKYAKIFLKAPVMLTIQVLFHAFWSFILSLLVGLGFKKEFPED